MGDLISPLWQDLRYAFRALIRTPGITIVALASLALGIGANTALFSLFNALVLRSLPVPHPEQLVSMATTIADNPNRNEPFSWPMFAEIERRQQAFSGVFAWAGGGITDFEANNQRFTAGLDAVSGNYFRVMGVEPYLGRFITPADVASEAGISNTVAVISYRCWKQRYNGHPKVVGQTIRIGGHPFTVIGVAPPRFSGLIIDGASDVTVPLFAPDRAERLPPMILWLNIFGRLNPASRSMALARVWQLSGHVFRKPQYRPAMKARDASGCSLAKSTTACRNRYLLHAQAFLASAHHSPDRGGRSPHYRLPESCQSHAGASGGAQTRTGHSDSTGRRGLEIITTIARGSSSAFGDRCAALGAILALWASRALLHIMWTGLIATPLSTSPDWRVGAFTTAIALLTGFLFGLAPAWNSARTDPKAALERTSRSVRSGSSRFGKVLVVAQMALSLTVLIGALLFGRSLSNLYEKDAGYRRDHLLTLQLFPQPGHTKVSDHTAYFHDLADKMARLPGISSVSYSNDGPANQFEYTNLVSTLQGKEFLQAMREESLRTFFAPWACVS